MKDRPSQDILTNLTHFVPTSAFLSFQALASVFTNTGDCGPTERFVTGVLLFLFFCITFCLKFTDSVTTQKGRVYYGIVTNKGLYNPQFKTANLKGDLIRGDEYFTGGENNRDYTISFNDFVNAFAAVLVFGVLTCLTPPITTCYYKGISSTLTRSVPILVTICVVILYSLFPSGRHGLGFALSSSGFGFVPEKDGPQHTSFLAPQQPDTHRPADTEITIERKGISTTTEVDEKETMSRKELPSSSMSSGAENLGILRSVETFGDAPIDIVILFGDGLCTEFVCPPAIHRTFLAIVKIIP